MRCNGIADARYSEMVYNDHDTTMRWNLHYVSSAFNTVAFIGADSFHFILISFNDMVSLYIEWIECMVCLFVWWSMGSGTRDKMENQQIQRLLRRYHGLHSLFLFLFFVLIVITLIPFNLFLIDTLCIAQNYSFSNVSDPVFFVIFGFGHE